MQQPTTIGFAPKGPFMPEKRWRRHLIDSNYTSSQPSNTHKKNIESLKVAMHTISKQISANRLLPRYDSNKSLFLKKTLPLTVISFALGLAPMKMGDGRFEFSFCRITYGFMLISSSAVARICLEKYEEAPSFYSSVLHVDSLILPVSCLMSMIWLSFYGKKLIGIVDKSVQLLVFVEPQNIMKQNQQFITMGMTFLILCTTIIYEGLTSSVHTEVSTTISYCLDIHLAMTMCIIQIQFVVGINSFTNSLSSVRNAVTCLFPIHQKGFRVTSEDIDEIFGLSEIIVKLMDGMVSAYGCVLGVSSLMTIAHCITFSYAMVVNPDVALNPSITVWTVLLLMHQWLILTAAERFAAEVESTCQLTYQAYRDVKLINVQEQLHDFLIYLLHRKVDFSICGLVPFNYSLLFTMAGSVTTYMVILVQFQKDQN